MNQTASCIYHRLGLHLLRLPMFLVLSWRVRCCRLMGHLFAGGVAKRLAHVDKQCLLASFFLWGFFKFTDLQLQYIYSWWFIRWFTDQIGKGWQKLTKVGKSRQKLAKFGIGCRPHANQRQQIGGMYPLFKLCMSSLWILLVYPVVCHRYVSQWQYNCSGDLFLSFLFSESWMYYFWAYVRFFQKTTTNNHVFLSPYICWAIM